MDPSISDLLHAYFGISHAKTDEILQLFDNQRVMKGKFFFKKSQRTVPLAFIQEGYIRIYDNNNNGKEITQWISGPGELITDIIGLFFDNPNRWNAVALTDVKLAVISHSDYKSLSTKIKDWPALEKALIAKCFRTLEERVFSFLSMSAQERYDKFITEKPDLSSTIALQYLASILGITPETLSRIRGKR